MDVTDVTGPFGNFQKRILLVLLIRPICWALVRNNYQFIVQKVPFRCQDVLVENSSYLSSFSNGYDRKCRTDTSLNETYVCERFDYDQNKTFTTITEEWDLVCSREWLISLGYMAFSFGNFLSYTPSGHVADKFGRKPVMLIGQGTLVIVSIIISFSNSISMLLILRFLVGIGYGLAQTPLFASYIESVGPKYRDYVVYGFAATWGFGNMLVSFVAWLIQDWRWLVILVSFPFQIPLLLGIYLLVPESTRWLLSTKQYHKAEQQLKQQAKLNGKEIGDITKVMSQLKSKIDLDVNSDKSSFLDLLKNSHLRKVATILYISFISTVFINHGFGITIALESGSIYLNLCLSGLSEIPAVLVYFLVVKYFNRRQSLFISFIFTGLAFLAVIPINDDLLWLKLTIALLGRTANSFAYALIYVYANELFPTNVRAVAVSGAMTAGRIGYILAPFADLLGRIHGKSMPLILYGVLSLTTSAIFLLLPETQNKPLPDTVHDFEKLATEKGLNKATVNEQDP